MTSSEISHAVDILRRGGLVAMPTETVYGLAADAENELAVRRIFAAKGRPADHPLIVHLASGASLAGWTSNVPADAERLARRFWPGPLTLILPLGEKAADSVTGGLPSIGIRVPDHPLAQELLREFGGGVAAPSANRFGRVSPTAAAHVAEELGNAVDCLLDGGPCRVGVESTIVDFSQDQPALLRPGVITLAEIEHELGYQLADPATNPTRCSGRLESHYAPRAGVELHTQESLASRLRELTADARRRVVVLSDATPRSYADMRWIHLPSDPLQCAARLYSALREVDAQAAELALVVLPAAEGVGVAVRDRLTKAAARPKG